ncbi:MAG: HPP family protein [Dehalococcoidales bacterium]
MHLLSYLQRRLSRIRGEFPRLWKNYLYQSLLAMVVVFIVLLLLTVEHAVVIASIGSTAFIVFTMPRNITAKPRRVIGGHLVGLLSGSLCALIPHSSIFSSIIVYSLAVGIAIFLMVALDVEHPPAGGTALGIAITGFSYNVATAILTSSIILALAHRFSVRFLKDLT